MGQIKASAGRSGDVSCHACVIWRCALTLASQSELRDTSLRLCRIVPARPWAQTGGKDEEWIVRRHVLPTPICRTSLMLESENRERKDFHCRWLCSGCIWGLVIWSRSEIQWRTTVVMAACLYFVIFHFIWTMNISCLWPSSYLKDLLKKLKSTLNLHGIAERMRRILSP